MDRDANSSCGQLNCSCGMRAPGLEWNWTLASE